MALRDVQEPRNIVLDYAPDDAQHYEATHDADADDWRACTDAVKVCTIAYAYANEEMCHSSAYYRGIYVQTCLCQYGYGKDRAYSPAASPAQAASLAGHLSRLNMQRLRNDTDASSNHQRLSRRVKEATTAHWEHAWAHLQLPRYSLRKCWQRAADATDIADIERLQAAHIAPGYRNCAHKVCVACPSSRRVRYREALAMQATHFPSTRMQGNTRRPFHVQQAIG